MANFCTNCGTRLGKGDNFCTNCGTRINNSDIKQDNHLKSMHDSIEKNRAKEELKRVVGGRFSYNKTFTKALLEGGLGVSVENAIEQQVKKEIDSGQIKSGGVEFRVNQLRAEYKTKMEEDNKKLKMIDEIFESEEIKSQIINQNVQAHVTSIKDDLKEKLIDKRENMSEDEIRYFIKNELEKAWIAEENARIAREKARIAEENTRIAEEKERTSKKIEKNGGYCNYGCMHYREQFIDSGGGIDLDFTGEEIVDSYCALGHPLSYGSFCKYYE